MILKQLDASSWVIGTSIAFQNESPSNTTAVIMYFSLVIIDGFVINAFISHLVTGSKWICFPNIPLNL
ncbi:MAG: hypothetical protein MRY83_13705 [Flavobacteriales bacterium]|nr:hypothetical protein [Flavobacteriales bacterium]